MKANWIVLSLVAMLSFSLLVIFFTMLTRKGLSVTLILFVIAVIVGIFYLIRLLTSSQFSLNFSWQTISLLIIISVLSFIGNWAQFQATSNAPNPGLVIAVVAFDAAVITIIASIFLKDKSILFS